MRKSVFKAALVAGAVLIASVGISVRYISSPTHANALGAISYMASHPRFSQLNSVAIDVTSNVVENQPSNPQISRGTIIARARSWMNPQVSYSESSYYGGYRTDCSGYVSMAWNLPSSLNTLTLVTSGITDQISKDDLQAGDIVDNPSGGGDWNLAHVLIFDSWVDSSHTHYNAYEENPYWGGAHYTQNIPYPFWPGPYDDQDYSAYRLRQTDSNNPAPPTSPVDSETFVSQSANPSYFNVGQQVSIYFTERNTGNTT
jgi:hypothetical protein